MGRGLDHTSQMSVRALNAYVRIQLCLRKGDVISSERFQTTEVLVHNDHRKFGCICLEVALVYSTASRRQMDDSERLVLSRVKKKDAGDPSEGFLPLI